MGEQFRSAPANAVLDERWYVVLGMSAGRIPRPHPSAPRQAIPDGAGDLLSAGPELPAGTQVPVAFSALRTGRCTKQEAVKRCPAFLPVLDFNREIEFSLVSCDHLRPRSAKKPHGSRKPKQVRSARPRPGHEDLP